MQKVINCAAIFITAVIFSFSDLIPGFDYKNIHLNRYGESIELDIFKINPDSIDIDIINLDRNKTIKSLLEEEGKAAEYFLVCNAGMFDVDYKTSMGYMKKNGKVLNSKDHPNYHSVMAFDPLLPDIPSFYIYDTDITPLDSIISIYDSVIENLRLIKRNGQNRWPEQSKSWSELAIGQDIYNNILIIYCHNISQHFIWLKLECGWVRKIII